MENLTSPKTVKILLEKKGMSPNKRLGQNFLIDRRALERVLAAAELSSQDTVVEVGPGLGMLTKALAEKAKKVIAVEKDPRMVEILQDTVGKQCRNIQIIQGDILKINFQIRNPKSETNPKSQNTKYKIRDTTYKVVANLPYYITSPVIRKFLETRPQPKLMVLMVQKEVAQRICAKPPDMSLLAVAVQLYAKPKIVSHVSKNSFWPVPKVDSAIVRIAPLINADTKLIDADTFFRVVKAGFKQPRKQLANNLAKGLGIKKEVVAEWLKNNRVKPSQRAETLSLQDWMRLAKSGIIEA